MMSVSKELVHARTCYKHLAGALGVGIARSFLSQGLIKHVLTQGNPCFSLTTKGRRWCRTHGVAANNGLNFDAAAQGMTKSCLDHSHQEPHIAGPLGRSILSFMIANNYCKCAPGRRVSVTASGLCFLRVVLGIDWSNYYEGAEK